MKYVKELAPEGKSGMGFHVYVTHHDVISMAKFMLTSVIITQIQQPGPGCSELYSCIWSPAAVKSWGGGGKALE